jgi:hypothetical protein
MLRLISTGLAAAVLAGVVALATPPATARAAIGPIYLATLEVKDTPDSPDLYCDVSVDGRIAMTQLEADRLLAHKYRVVVRLWGEDSFSDDLLLGPWYVAGGRYGDEAYLIAGPYGLRFHKHARVYSTKLNEDNTPAFDEGDEVYAGIRLVNSLGATLRAGETNRKRDDYNLSC